jgi:hypothetical protein
VRAGKLEGSGQAGSELEFLQKLNLTSKLEAAIIDVEKKERKLTG